MEDSKDPNIQDVLAQQEADGPTPADEHRLALRELDNEYREVAALADKLLTGAQQTKKVDFFALDYLQQRVRNFYGQIEQAGLSSLFQILQLVRFDTRYYQYHAVNVGLLNATIGTMMALDDFDMDQLVEVGLIMDLGMLLLPDSILNSTQKLSDFERAMIRKHPEFTADILRKSGFDDEVIQAVQCHHERYNGTGYPLGLAGEQIPLWSRITTVSDSFDAATAYKKHRTSKSPFTILEELRANADGALDPGIARTAATGLAEMLMGHWVVLSDRSVGKVVQIFPENLAYPTVIVVGRKVQTGPELYPVSLSGTQRLF